MPGFVEMGEEGAPPDQSPPMRPNSVDPTQVTVESPKTMNVEASASTNSLSAAQNHTVAKFFSTLLTNKVPTAYRQKAGQKACCVLLAMQVAVFTAGLATFGAEVELCTYEKFAAYTPSAGYCEAADGGVTDSFNLDDSGYWDTKNKFAFAKSMVTGVFHQYSSEQIDWRGTEHKSSASTSEAGISKDFYKVLKRWNEKWQVWNTAQTLVAMVSSSETVSGTASTVEVQINADPVAIMKTENYYVQYAQMLYDDDEPYKAVNELHPRQFYYTDTNLVYNDIGDDTFTLVFPGNIGIESTGFKNAFKNKDDDKGGNMRLDDDDELGLDAYMSKTFPVTTNDWSFPTPPPSSKIVITQPPTPKPSLKPTPGPVGVPTLRPTAVGWNKGGDAFKSVAEDLTADDTSIVINK